MRSLKPYPNFNMLDDAGGLVLAAAFIVIGLGVPGLLLLHTGPVGTTIAVVLLTLPALIIVAALLLFTGTLLKFVTCEAINSIHDIQDRRQRHLHHQQQHHYNQQKHTQQQQQLIVELERREHEKRSHPDQMQ